MPWMYKSFTLELRNGIYRPSQSTTAIQSSAFTWNDGIDHALHALNCDEIYTAPFRTLEKINSGKFTRKKEFR